MSSSSWSLIDCPPPTGRLARLTRAIGLRVIRLPRQRVVLLAGTPGHLRDLMATPASATSVRAVRIMLPWQAIRPGWSGAIDPLPRLRRHRVSLPLRRRGLATVTLRLHQPLPLRDVVRSALAALVPVRPLPMPASVDVAAAGVLPAFLPPTAHVGALPSPDEIRPTDVLLSQDQADPAAAGIVLATDGTRAGGTVLLDAIRINPRARADKTATARVRLVLDKSTGANVRSGRLDGLGLDASTVEMLRGVATVEANELTGDPGQVAALLVQIAATGAVLRIGDLSPAVATLLSPELAAVLAEPLPAGDDPVALEAHSVRQRRAALRGHAAGLVLPRLVAGAFPLLGELPTVSAILMTRRPDRLAPVLEALEKQSYPELEIVVGLHGCAVTESLTAWAAKCPRPVSVVEVPAGVDFGTALGLATTRSSGSLVTKVDDDDTYGPEHVWDLVLARHFSGATLVGKGAEFVHLEERDETIRRKSGNSEAYAEVVAGGTILIGRGDLENAGGWRPVPRSVDLGLITRVKAGGGLVYRTHPFGYVYHRRAQGHTWDPGERYFLDAAFARWPGLPPYAEFGVPLGASA